MPNQHTTDEYEHRTPSFWMTDFEACVFWTVSVGLSGDATGGA